MRVLKLAMIINQAKCRGGMNPNRRNFLIAAAGALPASHLIGQDLVYQCPMDPDVRSNVAGVCPRCGMKLRSGIPEPIEFPMDMKITPRTAKAGEKAQLEFSVLDPANAKLVQHFQVVHEKLFHMFIISQDLQYFVHDHPVFGADGKFRYDITFPKPGLYRILGDFFPDGATPQLIAKTIIVPGGVQPTPSLNRDYSTRDAANMQVSLETDPPNRSPATRQSCCSSSRNWSARSIHL